MREGVPLNQYTTLKLGGLASYFFAVRSPEELVEALHFAKDRQLPWFILGGGSNVLFSDEGYKGVVIKMEIVGVQVSEAKGVVELSVKAGESWDQLVQRAVSHSWQGLENLSAIPGTVGAAPIQNIGAYGSEVSQTVAWVEVLRVDTETIERLSPQECHFGYRTSLFKASEGKHLIVLAVGFTLSKGGDPDLHYKDVADYFKDFSGTPTLLEVRQAIQKIRSKKFPDLTRYGTAGSYFKNPMVTQRTAEELEQRFPGLPIYDVDGKYVKLSLAWILDHVLNLRGYRLGEVGLHERQPLVVINFGHATSAELRSFAAHIEHEVREATGVSIFPEVVQV